jgi:hypothetical protein
VIDSKPTPASQLPGNRELPLHGVFYPLGFAVEIITNDPAVLEAAGVSFGNLYSRQTSTALQIRIDVSEGGDECPPEPARRAHRHLFSLVADADNQALLDLESCTCYIWLKKVTVNHSLYLRSHFLEKTVYLLLGSSVVTDLHAACVSKGGKGVLLCGDSGAGKSTLSYACARAGWTYTSDDTSYMINDSEVPCVVGHSHRVRFRPDSKTLFPELEGRELTQRLEGKPSIEVPTIELPGLVTASEVEVRSIVYLNRSPSGTGTLIPVPLSTAMQRACETLYFVGEIRPAQEKALQRLSAMPTYELQYRDLDHAIHQLDLLVQSLSLVTPAPSRNDPSA